MSTRMAEIRLTQNKEAIAKLTRLGKLVKDQYGLRYDAMINAMGIPFWVGHVKRIPAEWAEGLVNDNVMPIDEVCINCEGKRRVFGSRCDACQGTGWGLTNREAPLFKILSTDDPLTENPQTYQAPPPLEETKAAKGKEVVKALAE